MEYRDGMVDRLAMAPEDPHRPLGFRRGAEEDVLKEALLDVVGTGAGEKNAVRRHLRHRMPVHLLVGAEGPRDIAPFFDESGGIEDDEIVVPLASF